MGRKSTAEVRRRQIVWALYDCLAEKGQEKVTVKEIAAGAGLPPGVIHYYFKTKDEIVIGLTGELVAEYTGLLEDHLSGAVGLSQAVEAVLDFAVDRFVFDRRLNRVFYNLVQMGFEREPLSQSLKELLRAYRGRIARIFEPLAGEDESRTLAAALVAVTEGFALQWMIDPQAFTRDEVRRLAAWALSSRLSEVSGKPVHIDGE